ncbi:hypothetical protein Cadr_000010974 [Camelus dromedarius]|uniref:Uncharacterized protein n=1 Tax=Camelus dromedarius TaxID=9838 RepID=A0A5N4DVR5_CAMDR|nr:hypothetical protein Cadr_000010974 [Camelus dromedarius]
MKGKERGPRADLEGPAPPVLNFAAVLKAAHPVKHVDQELRDRGLHMKRARFPPIIPRAQQVSPSPAHKGTKAACKPRQGLRGNQHCQHLGLGLPASRTTLPWAAVVCSF